MDPITATAKVAAVAVPLVAGLDGQALTTSAIAGLVLSHVLKPYMSLITAPALKPLVPALTAIGGAVATCMSQGMGFKEALHYGVVTAGAAMLNHRLAFAKPAV